MILRRIKAEGRRRKIAWVLDREGGNHSEIGRATQARHLRELEAMTEDLVSIMTGEEPGAFTVEYDIRLPEAAQAHLERAEELRRKAAATRAQATAEAREAVRELRRLGLTVRDIGKALGVSFQRAHQLAG